MNKLVSIIVPVYNIESYIGACLESLQHQTYQNIEVLIIDDGSRDNSKEICIPYTQDKRFRYIYKENGGLSDARNVGVQHAQGEYIAFVDGDDTVEPQFIEKLVYSIEKNNTDIAICSFYITNSAYQDESIVSVCDADGIENGRELLKKVFDKDGYKFVVVWNKLYRRKIFDTLTFVVGKLHEDEYFNFELLYNFTSVSVVSDPLYHYVQRSGSIVHSAMTKKRLEDQRGFLKSRIAFYEKHNEKELLYLSKKTYNGWLICAIVYHTSLLSKNDQKVYQKEFRKYVLLFTYNQNIILIIRNVVGYISLKLLHMVIKLKTLMIAK